MATLEKLTGSAFMDWLDVSPAGEQGLFKLVFKPYHIGNPWIRSIHGGVTGSFMELAAQLIVLGKLDDGSSAEVSTNSTDYLRVTKDQDVFGRATITRISRRLAMVDVWCWQDSEDLPVTHGTITLRIQRPENT